MIDTLKKHQMGHYLSFTAIEKEIKSNKFQNIDEFGKAVRGYFSNCFSENIGNGQVYVAAMQVSNLFESTFKDYEKPLIKQKVKNILELKKKVSKLSKDVRDYSQVKTISKLNQIKNEKKISKKEKFDLLNKISHLNSSQIKGIVNIIPEVASLNENSIELSIEKISFNKFVTLDIYVENCLKERTVPPNASTSETIKRKESINNIIEASSQVSNENNLIRKNSIILDDSSILSEDSSEDEEEFGKNMLTLDSIDGLK